MLPGERANRSFLSRETRFSYQNAIQLGQNLDWQDDVVRANLLKQRDHIVSSLKIIDTGRVDKQVRIERDDQPGCSSASSS